VSLHDTIASDALSVFLVADDFAEVVTYYPHRFYGESERADRSIRAVVFREGVRQSFEDVVTVVPYFEVHVANDAVNGIASDEIYLGKDQIGFPVRDGKSSERRTITSMTTQDHGMLVLQCQ